MKKAVAIAGVICFLSGMGSAFGSEKGPSFGDYFWCGYPDPPVQQNEKLFYPGDQKANFTSFHGFENVTVEDGVLSFALESDKATIGWGNYLGRQQVRDIVDMFFTKNIVRLKIRQMGTDKTALTLRFWVNGKRMERVLPSEATLEGKDAQELVFDKGYQSPIPDGFEIKFVGKKDARYFVEYVKVVQPYRVSYIRKEYDLPQGKIWRAIADMGGRQSSTEPKELYINGHKIRWESTRDYYHFTSIDIAPYLKPGKNCVAIFGFRQDYPPFVPFQAKIVMVSGETFTWQTDTSWKRAPREVEGWNRPGFDDSSWANLKVTGLGHYYVRSYGRDGRSPLPDYKGSLVIRNPLKTDLIYRDDQDLVLEVNAPGGLQKHNPTLAYQFGKADAEGKTSLLKEGIVPQSKAKADSLTYSLNLGKHSLGVYTISLQLKDDNGQILQIRPREPLLVLRRLKPRLVSNPAQYRDALDIELEDSIDFTDPNDPHPWIEGQRPKTRGKPMIEITEPTIARRKGLVYRKVDDSAESFLSYRFEFKHPGSFYLLEFEYPDDAERFIHVSISTKFEGGWNSQSGVGVTTGGHYFLTGKMQRQPWIHVADAGPHSVDIVNPNPGCNAAAGGLKIYRIKGDLPAIENGSQRLYGIHTERCFHSSGLGRNFGSEPLLGVGKQRGEDAEKIPIMQRFIKDLLWMAETCDRYAQYLKFVGQNMHIMGCLQYNESNTPYVIPYQTDTARVPFCMKSILANTLEVNDIYFWAGLELITLGGSRPYNDAQVAKGADTIWRINERGEQVAGMVVCQNWMHPRFRQRVRIITEDVAKKFGDLPHFKGIHSVVGPHVWLPDATDSKREWDDPFTSSFDDVTSREFEEFSGLSLPISKDDPERFKKRAALLKNAHIKRKYRDFRCRKFRELCGEMLATLKKTRSDLQLVNLILEAYADLQQHRAETGRDPLDYYKDFAFDLDLFRNQKDLCIGRWTYSAPMGVRQNPYYWAGRTDPELAAAFDNTTNRYVFAESRWKENAYTVGGYVPSSGPRKVVRSDWIIGTNTVRACPSPSGFHVREALAQALVTGEANILGFGFTDLNVNVGYEARLRSFTQVFTLLPREKFTPVLNTDLTTNLAIRRLIKGARSWFYIVNPGYWHIQAEVQLRTSGTVYDLVTGKKVKLSDRSGKKTLSLSLEPYGLVGYRVDSPHLEIVSYTTGSMSEQERKFMEDIMQRVEALLDQPEVKLVLPPEDRDFMGTTTEKARENLLDGNYARAWSLVSHWKFWSLWKDFLERAAGAVALLPDSMAKEQADNRNEVLPTLVAAYSSQPMRIDGRLDETAWSRKKFSVGFLTREGKPAFAQAGVKALYDEKNVYFGFVCADRDPKSLKAVAEEEQDVFHVRDDAIATFIQPDETRPIYYQLAFNTKGVQFDQRVVGAERDYEYHPDWKVAVHVDKGYWSAEVALSYQAFDLADQGRGNWRINFHRIFRENQVDPSSWSFSGIEWHKPERFGRLMFRPK